MTNNQDTMKRNFLNTIPSKYVTEMRKDKVWGGDLELQEIANLYNMEIIVFKERVKLHPIKSRTAPVDRKIYLRINDEENGSGHYSVSDQHGNITHRVAGDGNCLFSACYVAVSNAKLKPSDSNIHINNPKDLRERTCDYLNRENQSSNQNNSIRVRFEAILEATTKEQFITAIHLLPNIQLRQQAIDLRNRIIRVQTGGVDMQSQENNRTKEASEVEKLQKEKRDLEQKLETLNNSKLLLEGELAAYTRTQGKMPQHRINKALRNAGGTDKHVVSNVHTNQQALIEIRGQIQELKERISIKDDELKELEKNIIAANLAQDKVFLDKVFRGVFNAAADKTEALNQAIRYLREKYPQLPMSMVSNNILPSISDYLRCGKPGENIDELRKKEANVVLVFLTLAGIAISTNILGSMTANKLIQQFATYYLTKAPLGIKDNVFQQFLATGVLTSGAKAVKIVAGLMSLMTSYCVSSRASAVLFGVHSDKKRPRNDDQVSQRQHEEHEPEPKRRKK